MVAARSSYLCTNSPLGTQVVDLIRLYFLDDADQVGGVGEVSVMAVGCFSLVESGVGFG